MIARSLTLLGLATCAWAKVQYLGVAIAGGDFGCSTDGTCSTSSVQFPSDGADQMKHFVGEGMNLMRIPTSWQYLVNNQLGAALDSTNLATYDNLVQSCLDTGAHCMIDIHNFARWNGGIIGQGGPSDDQFVDLWTQLATKYAANENVVFEIMNEPHDLDINLWAQTCQKVVTAIRNAGATSQIILLPGTNYDSAATLVSSGSAAALLNVTNPDGSTDSLVLDIHKYLDEDNSGTHDECVTDNVDAFTELGQFLRENGRLGLISESGASDSTSCLADFCSQNRFINQNSDVFLGFVAWAAGSFSSSYILSLTPTKQSGQYSDTTLMTQCVLNTWTGSNSTSSNNTSSITTGSGYNATLPSASSSRSTSTSAPASTTAFTSASASITGLMTATGTPTAGDGATTMESILISGTSVIEPETWSLNTLTTLLMATGLPSHGPAEFTGLATASATGLATATRAMTSSTGASATSTSGASPITAPPSLTLGGLTLCGLLAILGL